MADNRKILTKIRGEKGKHFVLGNEEDLAAAYGQARLDELKRGGYIEGDWTSTKSDSPLHIIGDGKMSAGIASSLAESGAEITNQKSAEFTPLSLEETVQRMQKMDFSEEVTRSMTFHGDDLKKALKESVKTGEGSGKSKDAPKEGEKPENGKSVETDKTDETDDYPAGFPALIKGRLLKIGKKYAEIKDLPKDKLVDLNGIADTSADEILEFIAKHPK